MADPHGTGEVSRKALSWGLACEDTNLNHPFLYCPVYPDVSSALTQNGLFLSPLLLHWKVNVVCLLIGDGIYFLGQWVLFSQNWVCWWLILRKFLIHIFSPLCT